MDRSTSWKYLSRVNQALTDGEQQISWQRQLILQLEAQGKDSSKARDVLSRFEAVQKLRFAKRDRLLAELTDFADQETLPEASSPPRKTEERERT
jgi:cell division protein FtsX